MPHGNASGNKQNPVHSRTGARQDVAASLGMGVADSGERPLSDVLLDGVPGSDEPVEGDPTPVDPERARRLILKLTGKEARGE